VSRVRICRISSRSLCSRSPARAPLPHICSARAPSEYFRVRGSWANPLGTPPLSPTACGARTASWIILSVAPPSRSARSGRWFSHLSHAHLYCFTIPLSPRAHNNSITRICVRVHSFVFPPPLNMKLFALASILATAAATATVVDLAAADAPAFFMGTGSGAGSGDDLPDPMAACNSAAPQCSECNYVSLCTQECAGFRACAMAVHDPDGSKTAAFTTHVLSMCVASDTQGDTSQFQKFCDML